MTRWVTVTPVGALPEGAVGGASVGGVEVVVVNANGRYHCLGGVCTHAGCSLAFDGELVGDALVCGCHGSAFDLATGAVVRPPAQQPLPVYDVRVEDGAAQVAWPAG
jgi:3-phenylpropionate/trans-cinnamate dioxygenase ferredoxin subunit